MKMVKISKIALVVLALCAVSQPLQTDCAKESIKDTKTDSNSWFSLATLAHVWGTIKKNCEFTTNFSLFQSGQSKPVPKVTISVDPTLLKPHEVSYPYTASMAHLTKILPHRNLLLTPKPSTSLFSSNQKNWFWNDGVFTDNSKTEYQITHKGIDYRYVYNPEKKCWEPTGKNRMDYLTYYDYLLQNKQNLKPFIERLVTEMLDYSDTTFDRPDTKKKKFLIKTFTNFLLNEEKNKQSYLFVTGGPGINSFWPDFVSGLHSSLGEKKVKIERSKLESHPKYSSAENFIDNEYDYNAIFDVKKSPFVRAANNALFGNSGMNPGNYWGESSLSYFYLNVSNSCKGDTLLASLEELSKGIGLSVPKKQLNDLYQEYSRLEGTLKQTFLLSPYVNIYSYLATFWGHPRALHKDAFIRCITEQVKKNRGLDANTDIPLTTENVIGLLRTDPNNSCFTLPVYPTPRMLKWDCRASLTYPSINTIQTRMLDLSPISYDPKVAKLAGRKDFYYYSSEDDKIRHKILRKKMFRLVDQMVKKAREDGTLKIDQTDLSKKLT